MKFIETIQKINTMIGKFMAVIVLVIATLTLFVPKTGLWINPNWINYLLMIVMFGMGLTMKPQDFAIVFKNPKAIIIGCVAQFTIMPVLAFVLGKAFRLDTALLAGVILVGTCPGGTSSNVITYLSKGDVPLSVGMTSVNTLLAPFLTPAITYLFLRTSVQVNVLSMFISIVKVVLIPIGLGFLIDRLLGKYIEKAKSFLPTVSVLAITLIVACVVSHNSEKIIETGAVVFVVVILHNILGYGCGYLVAKVCRLKMPQKKAMAIEIGMQNSGLATSLAGTAFPSLAMATVPGAIFSVWHNISGAILASIFQQVKSENESENKSKNESEKE